MGGHRGGLGEEAEEEMGRGLLPRPRDVPWAAPGTKAEPIRLMPQGLSSFLNITCGDSV